MMLSLPGAVCLLWEMDIEMTLPVSFSLNEGLNQAFQHSNSVSFEGL